MFQNELPAKLAILCIEDDPDTLHYMSSLLALKFPQVDLYTAANGEAGLTLFCKWRPQIVVTDLSLPQMDGSTMAQRMRVLEPDTSIIVVSAHSDTVKRQEGAGQFDHYLLKPLDFRELVRMVEAVMADRGTLM